MTGVCDVDLLSHYVDGSLMLPARIELESHLKSCCACRQELESLRRIDAMLQSWGSVRTPVPDRAHHRILRTVERRKRLAPLLALNRMMPAAVGSTIAALLILGSVNLGVLYQTSAPSTSGTSSPTLSAAVIKQSSTLVRARRTSAVIGGYVAAPRSEPMQLSRRIQLEVN